MSKKYLDFLLLVLFFSSSFFIGGIEKVEAKVCPLGKYPQSTGTVVTDVITSSDGSTSFTNTSIEWQCQNVNKEESASSDPKGFEKYAIYLASFAKSLAALTFGIAALVIVYAGYLYTLNESGKDSNSVEKAKRLIIFAGGGIMFSLFTFVLQGIIMSVILNSSPNDDGVSQVRSEFEGRVPIPMLVQEK